MTVTPINRIRSLIAVTIETSKKLVGYFIGDIGALHQLIHIWKFEDDADRRAFWAALFADEQFMAFAQKVRPLVASQENKLMMAAPWGPTV